MEKYQEIERTIITKYRKTIWTKFIKGIKEYDMIQEGDKIELLDTMTLEKSHSIIQNMVSET